MLKGNDLRQQMEATQKGGTKLQPGIHTQVQLKDIDIQDKFVDIIFAKEGQEINKRIYFPVMSETKAWDGMTVQETYQTQVNKGTYHFIDLVKTMLGTQASDKIEGEDLKQFAASAKAMVNPIKDQVYLNLKVTSDGQWPKLPNYAGYLEKYEEGIASKLKLSPSENALIHGGSSKSDSSDFDPSKYA